MNLEQTLTDELESTARALDVPPPPAVAELGRRAVRERRRTRANRLAGVVLVAAAVIVAIVLGNQLGAPSTAPQPTRPSKSSGPFPTGAAPRIPYVVHDVLYVAGKPVPGRWWDVQTVHGTSVAELDDGLDGRPVLFRDGRATNLLDHAVGGARLSIKGTKVAWVEKTGSSAHVVVYDLLADRELGRLAVDTHRVSTEDGTQESIKWLGDDGSVTYGGSLGVRTWKPGSAPRDGRSTLAALGQYPVDYTEIAFSPDGDWLAWRTDRHGHSTPAQQLLGGVRFEAARNPDSAGTIALPAGYEVRTVAWESETNLLLTYVDHPDAPIVHFMRCSTQDRHCELVPTIADF